MKKNDCLSLVGWVLVSRIEDGTWYIAWDQIFSTKKDALALAKRGEWSHPYKAVRATLKCEGLVP